MQIIEKVKVLSKSVYYREDFQYHILPVIKNALFLGKKLNADLEVIETAALLHDIGRSNKAGFEAENEHNFIGAEKAREILKSFGCSKDFIEEIAHCILTHRGRSDLKPETLEAKIIANADALAHFDAFPAVLKVFLKTTDSFESAILELEQKMERDWNKKLTIPEAKKLAKPKYEAILLLLKSMKGYMKKKF